MNSKKMGLDKNIIILILVVSVLIFASSVTIALINVRSAMLIESQEKISEVTEIAYNVVRDCKAKADRGLITQEQAKALAADTISNFKYQGSNYVWVQSTDNKFLIHPTKKYGEDGSSLKDEHGVQFIVELTNSAKEGKNSFVEYEWPKPGMSDNNLYPKIATAKLIPGWNWVLATGTYIDEINQKVIATFLSIFVGSLISMVVIIVAVHLTFVKRLTGTLNNITNGLIASSNQISEASYHLGNASQQIASGAMEQAASIQEVSATLEETSSMVHKNNENTDQAAILAREAKEGAYKSYQEMDRMMSSMTEIKSSSNEISKIIKVIDEIAFQTNILALNAAVEAARAGEAGKGFAVVAEEVRNLAQRSTQSAKDTTQLIERNITLSEHGVDIANGVYDSILSIDTQAKKVSELLDEISVATKEQALGVEQIHLAIAQMEQVMQSSAQTADETASASQELHSQTASMNDMVDQMSELVNGSNNKYITATNHKLLNDNLSR